MWQILRHAPKWTNSGVVIHTATGIFNQPPPPSPELSNVRPVSQKQRRKDASADTEENRKAVLDQAHNLAAKKVQSQVESNMLIKAMLDLESQLRASQLVMDGLNNLDTYKSRYSNEERKLVLQEMEKEF